MYALDFRKLGRMSATSNMGIMEAAYQERNCAKGQFAVMDKRPSGGHSFLF